MWLVKDYLVEARYIWLVTCLLLPQLLPIATLEDCLSFQDWEQPHRYPLALRVILVRQRLYSWWVDKPHPRTSS